MKKKESNTSRLLSDQTAVVTISDISKSDGILSAKYHVHNLKGELPYVLREGKYVLAKNNEIKNAEYFDKTKVTHINNCLFAIKELYAEIESIKKAKNYCLDVKISESRLSSRAKNSCYRLLGKQDGMLSEVADTPISKWQRTRGMGNLVILELKQFLIANGFKIIE